MAVIAGAFIVIAGWWYWGNWVQFGEPTASTLVALNTGPRDVAVSWAELRGLYLSFWGVFGWFNILAPDAFYAWTLLILVLGFAGGVYGLLRRRPPLLSENGVIALLLGIHALLLVAGWWSFNALVLASQGRLLFPLLGTLGIVIAAGLRFFPRPVVIVLLVPLLLASVSFPFTRIAPVYAPSESFSAELWRPSPELRPVLLREPWQDDGCALLWIGSPRVDLAGSEIHINAAWQARCAITGFWSVFVHLSDLSLETCEAGDTDHILAQFDSMPDGGNTPLPALRPGYVIEDRLRVMMPADLDASALADLHVQVGLYDAGGTFIRAFVVEDDEMMGAPDARPEIGRCSPELVNLPLNQAINQPGSIE